MCMKFRHNWGSLPEDVYWHLVIILVCDHNCKRDQSCFFICNRLNNLVAPDRSIRHSHPYSLSIIPSTIYDPWNWIKCCYALQSIGFRIMQDDEYDLDSNDRITTLADCLFYLHNSWISHNLNIFPSAVE